MSDLDYQIAGTAGVVAVALLALAIALLIYAWNGYEKRRSQVRSLI